MSNPRIIIPGGSERIQASNSVQAVPGNDRPKYNLPQEMKDEVRKFIPEAKEVAAKIHDLLSKGPAAQVSLVCQEPVRAFLGEHIRSLLPQLVRSFAHADRTQIINFFRQMCENRTSLANMSAERVDKTTYNLAVSDLLSLISTLPAQVFPVEIGIPDLDLESPESEAPSTDTNQGET